MLEDRPYLRDSYERRRTGVLTWLISSIIAVFVVQNVAGRVPGLGYGLEGLLGLDPEGLRAGHLWTLLTYGFLHSTGNLLQVIAYVGALYLLGREIVPVTGARRFLGLYASALASGGLLWAAVHWNQPVLLVGSSAAVAALLVVYRCFYPNREISFTLFFVLPVRITPRFLVSCLLAVDACGLVFYEVLGWPSPFAFAHSAHLGGMAAGWVYYRYLHDSSWSHAPADADIELPRWMKQRADSKAAGAPPAYTVNLGDRGHLRAEVDRILDKINSDGFPSLSPEEKRVLDEARDMISRR
jgi:membrane associated rhomboid family serine protease